MKRWGRVPLAIVVLVAVSVGCSAGGDDDDSTEDAAPAEEQDPCATWSVETLGEDLGALENVLAEDNGGLLLSVSDAGEVRHFNPGGETTTVIDGVASSGGLARSGSWVYVTTGLTIDAALQGTANGSIVGFDPQSGEKETWASGLVAPNGLAVLEDGSAITTRTLSGGGVSSQVTRVPADDPASLEPMWSDLSGTNGAAVDPGGEWLYLSRVAERAEIWRLNVDDPAERELVVDLGGGTEVIPDDLTVTDDGIVYAAAFVTGDVLRIDPSTGKSCAIASDLAEVTAVELDPSGDGLFATSMAGTLYKLTPPRSA